MISDPHALPFGTKLRVDPFLQNPAAFPGRIEQQHQILTLPVTVDYIAAPDQQMDSQSLSVSCSSTELSSTGFPLPSTSVQSIR